MNTLDEICDKANSTIGFLKRNLNIGWTTVKENAYKSLVRPTLKYASTVWDRYQQNTINRLEMVQRCAARYVTNRLVNRSCVTDMLSHLGWKSLVPGRKEARLCMLFKIKRELDAINKSDRLVESQNSHNATFGNNNFIVPQSKCDYRKKSFLQRTMRDWSRLPPDIASAEALGAFKSQVAA